MALHLPARGVTLRVTVTDTAASPPPPGHTTVLSKSARARAGHSDGDVSKKFSNLLAMKSVTPGGARASAD